MVTPQAMLPSLKIADHYVGRVRHRKVSLMPLSTQYLIQS